MDKKKIARIVCPICIHGCDCLIRGKSDMIKCPTLLSLNALITEREKPIAKALQRAANEAYQNEIIDTEMKHISIGKGKEWETKAEWIGDRIAEWLRYAAMGKE